MKRPATYLSILSVLMNVFFRSNCLSLACVLLTTISTGMGTEVSQVSVAKISEFQQRAASNGLVLRLKKFPTTAAEVSFRVEEISKEVERRIALITSMPPEKCTFETTFGAFDYVTRILTDGEWNLNTVSQSSPSKDVRDAARTASLRMKETQLSLDLREDLYSILKKTNKSRLSSDEKRTADLILQRFSRAGMTLPSAVRSQVGALQKELAAATSEFDLNINESRAPLKFTAHELAGVPDSFLDSPGVRQNDGTFQVMADMPTHFDTILQNAINPETRRKVLTARSQRTREKNVPLLQKMVSLRAEIANLLGYASWADYITETKMAKNAATVYKFQTNLAAAVDHKFQQELEELRMLKVQETGDRSTKIYDWDLSYYIDQLLKQKYSLDRQKLRNFFQFQQTLDGMMSTFQKLFGLRFTQVPAEHAWAPDVQLYIVQDTVTGKLLGAFYLDMFPREGKYTHFACFTENLGGQTEDGRYELPVAVLLCNFSPPSATQPSLLQHKEVTTLFHEFGHVMHLLLSRSRYFTLAAVNVPWDFVEAPSQMFENWAWQKDVLDTFAADYRNPQQKISPDTIEALIRSRQAVSAISTRRSLCFGLTDLALHRVSPDEARKMDVIALSNRIYEETIIPPIPDSAGVASIVHLSSYSANCYGYIWSEVLSIDMASAFEQAPNRFLDSSVGKRLRDEVYAVAFNRDVEKSVESFLGRRTSDAAFLKHIGAEQKNGSAAQ